MIHTNSAIKQFERVAYLIAHYHTFSNINEIDYQILIKADYIVNTVKNFSNKFFKTQIGLKLLKTIYNI